MTTRIPLLLVGLGLSSAGAWADTGHEHHHATRPSASVDIPAARTLVIRATDFAFEPDQFELRAGEPTRIELKNVGEEEHALIVRPAGATEDLIHLHAKAGQTDAATFRLDLPDTYEVVCSVGDHEVLGMLGTLVVREAGQ